MEKSNKENTASASGTSGALAMQANNTIGFADTKVAVQSRMVTQLDGTQELFDVERLTASLKRHSEGLANEFVKLDLVVEKVRKGLTNCK